MARCETEIFSFKKRPIIRIQNNWRRRRLWRRSSVFSAYSIMYIFVTSSPLCLAAMSTLRWSAKERQKKHTYTHRRENPWWAFYPTASLRRICAQEITFIHGDSHTPTLTTVCILFCIYPFEFMPTCICPSSVDASVPMSGVSGVACVLCRLSLFFLNI